MQAANVKHGFTFNRLTNNLVLLVSAETLPKPQTVQPAEGEVR